VAQSRGAEIGGAPSEAGIGAGLERCHHGASNLVVGELDEVLVGEIGRPVQISGAEQTEDLGSLALLPGVFTVSRIVVGGLGFHEPTMADGAGGSLSIDWSGG
jgi:hypothetical protein